MKIEIWNDSAGEWCKMVVDGQIYRQGHSERAEWWRNLIRDYWDGNCKLNEIEIEENEYHSVYAYRNDSEIAPYLVKIESGYGDSEFLGYIDSIDDTKLKYNAEGNKQKRDIYIDVIGVDE